MDKNDLLNKKRFFQINSDKNVIDDDDTWCHEEATYENKIQKKLSKTGQKSDFHKKTINTHDFWVNIILFLHKSPYNNLISCGADGAIFIYGTYPNYEILLKIKEFGQRVGITYLTELKNGRIIACSLTKFKEIELIYNSKTNIQYKILNEVIISKRYIYKCIETTNNDLLFITKEYFFNIIKFYKTKNETTLKRYNDEYEISINALEINDNLIVTENIIDYNLISYDIIIKNENKYNNNLSFYDNKYNKIKVMHNILSDKTSSDNIVKINNENIILSISFNPNKNTDNFNNVLYGIALINYINFEFVSFYQTKNKISTLYFFEEKNMLLFGDSNGYISIFDILNSKNELIFNSSFNSNDFFIYSIQAINYLDQANNKNLFIIFSAGQDKNINYTII